jgi:hypothetical protein
MYVQVEDVTFEREKPPEGKPQQLGLIKTTFILFKTQEYADLAYSKLRTAKVS